MVQRAGVDVDKLIDLLVRNASAELTTYYYYTILRVNLIGLEGEGLKEITEDARIEDRNHFEALVPRIYELGGKLPKSMVDFHNVSAYPPAFIPTDPTNINDMLQILVEAERCALRGYTEICNMTFGKDHRTYDLRYYTKKSNTKLGSRNSLAKDQVAMRFGNRARILLMSVNSSAPNKAPWADRWNSVF
ncbi:MAG: ferritin-like domain-containing protein [Candidatus Acidiferrum sp.]